MEVKVLGPGCAKCKTTFQVIEKVIKENNLDVKLTKVDDIMEMMSYNIMTTPAAHHGAAVDEQLRVRTHDNHLQRLSGNPCGAGQMREQERRADALLLPRGCAALDFTRR